MQNILLYVMWIINDILTIYIILYYNYTILYYLYYNTEVFLQPFIKQTNKKHIDNANKNIIVNYKLLITRFWNVDTCLEIKSADTDLHWYQRSILL